MGVGAKYGEEEGVFASRDSRRRVREREHGIRDSYVVKEGVLVGLVRERGVGF